MKCYFSSLVPKEYDARTKEQREHSVIDLYHRIEVQSLWEDKLWINQM